MKKTSKKDVKKDNDIIFNNIKSEPTNKQEVKPEESNEETQIVSTANYDAEIYDTSTDFKSIGVRCT
jgi:hypothetical protein